MQTFLPYPDFGRSATVLDLKRLGKQRVENLQIMQAALGVRLVTTYALETGRTLPMFYDSQNRRVDPAHFDEEVHTVVEEDEVIISTMDPDKWFVEPLQNRGWANHPAVKMWVGNEQGLVFYQHAICSEWVRRGCVDTCLEKTDHLFSFKGSAKSKVTPTWMGDPGLHTSHQSNLLRKDPEYYKHYFPNVPPDLPYIWPI